MTKTKIVIISMILIFALAICLPLIFKGECEHQWGEYYVDSLHVSINNFYNPFISIRPR